MKSADAAKIVSGELNGDGNIEINGVGSLDNATETEISFIENDKHLSVLQKSKSNCVLAPFNLKGKINKKTVIYVEDVYSSLDKIIRHLTPDKEIKPGIHHTCVLGKNVKIGKDVFIGPYTVIGDGIEIGNKVVILGLCYIGDNSKIGDSTFIHSQVVIERGTIIGQKVIIHSGVVIGSDGFGYWYNKKIEQYFKKPQLGTVSIENDVEIGANTSIDRAAFKSTTIGKGTKIDNLVHIGHNVSIGENCLVIAHTGLGGSVKVGKEVIISGQCAIIDNVEIGDKVRIGGMSGVTKSLPPNNDYWGIPAVPLKEKKEEIALIRNLKEMKRKISLLEEEIKVIKASDKKTTG